MALSFDRFAPPADAPLTPCARCAFPVDSLDDRGRCDDCAGDPLLALVDEVSRPDLAVAVSLGRLSFSLRLAHDPRPACGCDLCETARVELDAWCDERRADYLAELDQRLPWQWAWTPLDAVASNDTPLADEVA